MAQEPLVCVKGGTKEYLSYHPSGFRPHAATVPHAEGLMIPRALTPL
jgi:hypothetical protein